MKNMTDESVLEIRKGFWQTIRILLNPLNA